MASALDAGLLGSLAWPAFGGAAGLVLVWRNGSDEERQLLRRAVTPLLEIGGGLGRSWTGLAGRLVVGAALALPGPWRSAWATAAPAGRSSGWG